MVKKDVLKICKDCKWYSKEVHHTETKNLWFTPWYTAQVKHMCQYQTSYIDRVTGDTVKSQPANEECDKAREDLYAFTNRGFCGYEGKYFEKR